MAHHQAAAHPLPGQAVNKWDALRELAVVRQQLGLSDRTLSVLQALLSFHPGADLGADPAALIVFPSNAAICARLNAMPCSTMRRHLSALVTAGLILRRDSPNGKRYVRSHKVSETGDREAFGFDLSPLCHRFGEIAVLAEETRAAAEAHTRLRQTVSVMRRDLAGLATYGASVELLPRWDRFSDLAALIARDLRRKLSFADLRALEKTLDAALTEARDLLEPTPVENTAPPPKLSTTPPQTEQHQQSSNKEPYRSERSIEDSSTPPEATASKDQIPSVPLRMVKTACPKIQTYAAGELRHWHQLLYAAETVRPMMGISPEVWDKAVQSMGPENAAITLAAMLERFTDLRSPGAYLRALSRKAGAQAYSTEPMISALLRKGA